MTPLNAGAPEALTSLATEHRKSDRMLEEYSVNRCKYSKEHSVGKRLITLEVLPTIGRQDCFNFRIVLVLELTTCSNLQQQALLRCPRNLYTSRHVVLCRVIAKRTRKASQNCLNIPINLRVPELPIDSEITQRLLPFYKTRHYPNADISQ